MKRIIKSLCKIWSIPSGRWQPQSNFLFIVSRKGEMTGVEVSGNVDETIIVSTQKRLSYNQTFTTEIIFWLKNCPCILPSTFQEKKWEKIRFKPLSHQASIFSYIQSFELVMAWSGYNRALLMWFRNFLLPAISVITSSSYKTQLKIWMETLTILSSFRQMYNNTNVDISNCLWLKS